MTGPAAPHAVPRHRAGVPGPPNRQRPSERPDRLSVLAALIGPEPVPTDARCWRCRAPSGEPCTRADGARPHAHGDRVRAVARWDRLRVEAAAALDVLVDPGVIVGAAEHRAADRVRRLRRCARQAGAPLRWRLPDRWEALAALDAAGVRDARR